MLIADYHGHHEELYIYSLPFTMVKLPIDRARDCNPKSS